MKFLLKAAALAALTTTFATPLAAQRLGAATVAVVDTDRIYRECTACKAAQTQLQSRLTAAQQRAQQLGQPLQTEAQSIQQAVRALNGKTPDQALQTRITALQTKETSANQELARLQQEIRSTQAHVAQQINQRLNPIINQVMQQRGANVAVDTGATLAHAASINITDAVLAQLNTALPSVSVTPLPQAQQPQQQPQGR